MIARLCQSTIVNCRLLKQYYHINKFALSLMAFSVIQPHTALRTGRESESQKGSTSLDIVSG